MKVLALSLVLALPGLALATPAAEVLGCARGNLPTSLRVQDIEFTTTSAEGSSSRLKARLHTRQQAGKDGGVRAMLRVQSPENLTGASYLVREAASYADEGLYVWLPSVKRVRRISGEFADGALLGTDFSYNDFKHLQNVYGGLAVAREAVAEKLQQREVWLVAFKPAAGVKSAYSEVQSWVDRESCLPLQIRYFADGKLRKQLRVPVAALKKVDRYWYPSLVEMQDLSTGSSTSLRVLGVLPDDQPAEHYFDPKSFYLGAARK